MIQRVVMVELKDAYKGEAAFGQIAQQTVETLRQAHGVLDVQAARPADDRTRREWDLCILVRFATIEDVEIYRTDPVHRAYADTFLRPLRKAIRVWNFVVEPYEATGKTGV